MNLRRAALAASLAVSATACQPSTAMPSGPPAATMPAATAAASPEPSIPGVGVAIDPQWITRPALSCGDERRFRPEALTGAGLAELGLDAAAGVLRATISDSPDYFPDSGWHRVAEAPGETTFVARGNPETPWMHIVVGDIDGVPGPVVMGQCHLQPVAPEGVTFAHWWLDPAAPLPTAGSTEMAILIREQACASGKPPEGRVLQPTVILDSDAISVAIGVTLTPGGADCPSNPSFGMRLDLPEPLGSRGLFDAGVFPPRPVTSEDPGM